ncbi:MAG TPA: FAD-dependent monooxygenase [Longimicrobiaceae bacterium]|nr:FAD-dependent monooxygenase [Longimicrobiaceae bacterium]
MSTDVLVVGAGPTGLFLAIWLAAAGVRVRIVDRLPGISPTSRALAVHARTLELYDTFGFAGRLVEQGHRMTRVNYRVRVRRVARIELGDLGTGISPFPFVLVLSQDRHEHILADHLAGLGVQVERDTELVALEQRDDGVAATLRTPAGEERCHARYLCGCDGARSLVRELLDAGFPGGTYGHRFYVADVEGDGPTADGELHLCLDEQDFCIVFPMSSARHVRLVGVVPEGAATAGFADVEERVRRTTGLEVRSVNWFSTYNIHHRVAARFRSGRVFLAGDAAHIHSPVGGQGMNTGIGDAANLAWKLAAVLRAGAPPELLDTYHPERHRLARTLVQTTDRLFNAAVSRARWARLVRLRITPLVVPRLLGLSFLQPLAFRTLSQVGIEYRPSPLSTGRAGRVRAGDRLPWVHAGGESNFAPLRDRVWQVHVYGEARSELTAWCAGRGLPLFRFPWSDAAHRAGLARGAVYLVRPDGYVGYAAPAQEVEPLRRYLQRWSA